MRSIITPKSEVKGDLGQASLGYDDFLLRCYEGWVDASANDRGRIEGVTLGQLGEIVAIVGGAFILAVGSRLRTASTVSARPYRL